MKIADYIVLPKEITPFERTYLTRVNRIALWFFAAHVPAFTLIAWFNDTRPWLALLLTSAVLLGPLVASRTLANPRSVSVVFGVTAMAMGGLLVNFGRGPMTIEMHFYFFVLLALLSVFANPMPICVAAVTVALHHALLWATLPTAVFNYEASIWAVVVHATFVVLESIAACFVARSFFDNVIGLDRIVQARTSALDATNRELRLVLDNVGQGFMTVERAGLVPSERSAILSRWFGEPTPGDTLHHWLSEADAAAAVWLEVGWEAAFEGVLPVEVCLHQLPRRMSAHGKYYELEYRAILEQDALKKVLVVISDVTERVEREEAEMAQREMLFVFERMLNDRAGFLSFLDEATRLVAVVVDASAATPDRLRALHTLKGSFGIYGVTSLVRACHELETAAFEASEALNGPAGAEIERRWGAFVSRLSGILGGAREDVVQIARSEYDGLRRNLRDGRLDNTTLLGFLDRWLRDPAEIPLQRLGEQARALAKRLGKGDIDVRVEAAGVRVPNKRWSAFWSALVHVIRNAVDHGFDDAETRARNGAAAPALVLSAKEGAGHIELTIRDNGRGIDWNSVRTKARALGLPADERGDVERALYADGLSTKADTTEISGRGVGMAAVLRECEALGGRIVVESDAGHGTAFRFVIPERPTVYPQAAE